MTRVVRRCLGRLDEYDAWLLGAVSVLCLLGTVMVYEAGSFRPEALRAGQGQAYYLLRQLARLALGAGVLGALAGLDYRVLRRRPVNWGLLGLGLGLMLLTVALGGLFASARNGCSRWLAILPVQPIEIAKIALAVFLAERLSDGWRQWGLDRDLLRLLAVPAALVAILVAQPNFGNALVIAAFTLVMLFLAGMPLRQLGLALGPVALLGALAATLQQQVEAVEGRVQLRLGEQVAHGQSRSGPGSTTGGSAGSGKSGSLPARSRKAPLQLRLRGSRMRR